MRDFKLDDSRSTLWDRIDSALGKWETQCIAAGAILGWIIGLYFLTNWVWKQGLKDYAAAGQ